MAKVKEIERYYYQKFMELIRKNGGFGLNEFLGIAAALIVAALVIIPGLKKFSIDIMSGLNTWWTNISTNIFPTS